jgi:hypothetical protein
LFYVDKKASTTNEKQREKSPRRFLVDVEQKTRAWTIPTPRYCTPTDDLNPVTLKGAVFSEQLMSSPKDQGSEPVKRSNGTSSSAEDPVPSDDTPVCDDEMLPSPEQPKEST